MKLSVGWPDRDAQPVCDGILAVKVRQLDCSPGVKSREAAAPGAGLLVAPDRDEYAVGFIQSATRRQDQYRHVIGQMGR